MIVPKTIEHLEKISDERYKQRKLEQLQDSDDEDNMKLTIHDDLVSLPELDIQDLREKGKGSEPDFDLELDFETLN